MFCTGSLLKEAVEDMEWAAGNGSVNLHLQRDPPSLSLQASGTGELEVKMDVSPSLFLLLFYFCFAWTSHLSFVLETCRDPSKVTSPAPL